MNICYFTIVEGMTSEQVKDFDFVLAQDPARSHLKRPKGAGALLGLLGSPPGQQKTKQKRPQKRSSKN